MQQGFPFLLRLSKHPELGRTLNFDLRYAIFNFRARVWAFNNWANLLTGLLLRRKFSTDAHAQDPCLGVIRAGPAAAVLIGS